jgi:phosphorylase kinase alpha/beta subunit
MIIINNERLLDLIQSNYSLENIESIVTFLNAQKTFEFPALKTGLFSAALLNSDTSYTGYSNVWVRDNVHIAHALYVLGKTEVAIRAMQTLMAFFEKYRHRFEDIIDNRVTPQNPMNRPHIRFNGQTLTEVDEEWSHAQNDALGYFLWLYCILIRDGLIKPTRKTVEMLALFPLYFQAIAYWEDEDSGHWEETRKVEASSIGTVVAGLKAFKQLKMKPEFIAFCCQYKGRIVNPRLLDELLEKGYTALNQILPAECIETDPLKNRRYDAALLFLIYPLGVLQDKIADQILADVQQHLVRDYGVCRYLGDSFWFADYKSILLSQQRTADFSGNITERNVFLKPRQEAQWCLFDPILSIIFGQKFQKTLEVSYLAQQIHYLNRSLGQLTAVNSVFGGFKCPELYYLAQGKYTPGDATPLLWTQANLALALKMFTQIKP